MAIFEQDASKKLVLDDTEALTCSIENWRDVDGHTEYVIRVQRGTITWKVHKRYNDFVVLHSRLQVSGLSLPLPPKKLLGNRSPEFITERQKGLQKYLNAVLMNPILVSSLPAKSFVDPANYCQPFSEIALQHVSLALRGEVGWEVAGPLAEIGWRLRKHFYQVRCKAAPKEDLIASWTDYGPDKYLEDKDVQAVLRSLVHLRHPHIYPIKLGLCTDVGGLVVRTSCKDGSLRDIICNSKPRLQFLKKYGNPKNHKPLGHAQVAQYGRQILEALKFLQDKGLPYGHLHTGNIIIEDDRVRLTDIENGILGVPSFYRPYYIQHKRVSNLEAVDVYCFGHALYEMSFGTPLQDSTVDALPSNCPQHLRSVIEMILSAESVRNALPTFDALLQHPFFNSVVLSSSNPGDRVCLKIPTSVKEQLKSTRAQLEERLKEEQKMVRSQKRLVRVQEMMSSEEEKKKQRHKKKQEQKQMKEQQQRERQMSGENKEGENGDSANSTSTATSIGTATPPSLSGSSNVPSPPPPPPPPPPSNSNGATPAVKDRSALLGAICNFNRANLRETKSAGKA